MNLPTAEQPLEEALKRWFGYNTFRIHQKEIVEGVLTGSDVVAILPTGAGKSLCYQLPAMLFPGTAIVISPLISLMQDQVAALIKSGIPAAYINSSLQGWDYQEIFNNLSSYKLLYVAPERLADESFIKHLRELAISFFIIDEAHCISQWGHAFRPDYRQLSLLKREFPDKPIMALTATATQEVQNDIIAQLMMKNPRLVKGSFDRPNLMIRITRKNNVTQQVRAFIKAHEEQSGIIYASTRKTVDSLYSELKSEGYAVGRYHAGMSDNERQAALHDFIHDKTPLMVATVAFGMGINKPDVRYVIHHDMPKSIEQYYQEIGRAGRDGLPSECLMLFSGQDISIYRFFAKDIEDPKLRTLTESKTNAMYSLCTSFRCRRIALLRYFGEHYPLKECQGCDSCIDDVEKIDGTIIAQKILSCVYRVKQNFGIKHVIDVLRGSKAQTVLSRGHDQLSTWNLMPEYSENELRYYIEALLAMGFLMQTPGEYPVLKWTETTRSVTAGGHKVEFKKKIFKESSKEKNKLSFQADCNQELLRELKALRMDISRRELIPPFGVFTDRALIEMATFFPTNDQNFLAINGVGRFKLEAYGKPFMEAIEHFCKSRGITPPATFSYQPVKAEPSKSSKLAPGETIHETVRLFKANKSLSEIASIRKLTQNTVTSHLALAIEQGFLPHIDPACVVDKERQDAIIKAAAEVGTERLKPIKDKLSEEISYDDIRFVLALQKCGKLPFS